MTGGKRIRLKTRLGSPLASPLSLTLLLPLSFSYDVRECPSICLDI